MVPQCSCKVYNHRTVGSSREWEHHFQVIWDGPETGLLQANVKKSTCILFGVYEAGEVGHVHVQYVKYSPKPIGTL
ncbi:unnamed protein product [Sphenostylis stenocarpa]|uniref:Uncharacterized protein n=1 Tax=Sphenostylis stenocarpa TaxID=92480 RepID=A0AA86SGU9_9FABA|nr:unnamed protein product [Sphenostylis stenocarpa]